jgi:hypothetical protein
LPLTPASTDVEGIDGMERGDRGTRRGSSGRWCARIAPALLLAASLTRASEAASPPFLNIVDPAVTLVPTPTDYANDYVEATGPAGVTLKVKTGSPTGLVLLVRLAGGAPEIAPGDLLVRTLSSPGPGGTSLSSYTALGFTDLTLWSTATAEGPFVLVDMDVRIRNLMNYSDAATTGFTTYTNTLIFTVIEP